MSRWGDDRGTFEDSKGRPLVPTEETKSRWGELGKERNKDSDYMRYLQSRRSPESLSEAGKAGFRATAEKYGYDAAMEFSARYFREHPDRASEPERRMIELLRDLGQERQRDYEHIYKTAPGVWADLAWPDRMKALEVWGGVHDERVLRRLDPEHVDNRLMRDRQRIEAMQERGWEVKVVMARELEPSRLDRTREHIERFLVPDRQEQLTIPGVFEPERGEDARKYQAEMKVVEMLAEAGLKPGEGYAREYLVMKDSEPVGFAWPETKRAAQLYWNEREARADRPRRESLAERGWEVMVLREDRDLDPGRRGITTNALLRWSRREDESVQEVPR